MNHFKPPSPSPCPCSPPHSAPRLHLSLTRERVLASTRHHEQRTADHQSTHRASATQLFQPNPSQSISSHPAHHTQKTTRALGPSPPPHGPPKPAPRVLSLILRPSLSRPATRLSTWHSLAGSMAPSAPARLLPRWHQVFLLVFVCLWRRGHLPFFSCWGRVFPTIPQPHAHAQPVPTAHARRLWPEWPVARAATSGSTRRAAVDQTVVVRLFLLGVLA